ncbi:Lrp/AsnC family transcriptional regulator [Sinanaerobacter chloroacetimidivorans]|jgi:Lrp/AsnC family leucine-responsive transcriptional regulator|uniref:Lrp/AsnC family transcriptional regulator n=1 Tax=Sinanaerobacter chloroacetimidivorans TaxID=2818044 RepID=A0A8J7W776_9FIRM|nr:Lrp/AsnC family transcriptional regulator [Sinanaerobacter chloroacetimidivorans]MBR0600405.1 Lrp/AsnC family transcriptional regulator [Sinanaerobacter chloroacetimidivorans]
MDAIDSKILEVLQENSRVSISDLSKQVNLSLSAVSERLKKLEASNIIERFTVILDSKSLGKELSVLMNISLENPRNTKEFVDIVNKESEILECHYVTGEYDYILKITTKNTATLEALMNRIKSIPGIKRTQTNVVLSSLKHLYSVAPTADK